MADYPTPHIQATPGDFAKTVLMPGDPLRSRFVAEHFLQDARLVNDVRGVQGYTGIYEGHRVSVMASGMGMPSIGIYSHELYHVFGVENIIRIGSIGGIASRVHVRDLVIGMGASTNSRFAEQYHLPGTFAPICDFSLLRMAVEEAEASGLSYHVGNLLSADTFYNDTPGDPLQFEKMGVLGVEMEAAALYMTAARAGKRALAVCTVSDHLLTGESLSSAERQSGFTDMMRLALRVACRADGEEERT